MANSNKKEYEKLTMPELKAEAEKLAAKWNESAEFAEYKTMRDITKELDEVVSVYSQKAESQCFIDLMKADNVLRAAAEMLVFPTIKVNKTEEKDSGREVMTIGDTARRIDPLKLHKKSSDGYGFDKRWPAMVERLNFAMTIRRALELEVKPSQITEIRDCYAMSQMAHEYEEFKTSGGNGKNPTSVNALVEDVQKVIDGMMGEGLTVTKADINYLLSIYSKKNNKKALSVTCANHKYMRQYILEIAHRAITGEQYSVEFKKVKTA